MLTDLHQGLVARGRPVLAAGLQDLLVQLGDERLIAFEQFHALAVGTSQASFTDSLRTDLGLEPGRTDGP
jgi:hypothetical protein